MIVLDASPVMELLLRGERAEPVTPWLEAEEGELHVPALLDVHVLQTLRRLEASATMEAPRARAAVESLQARFG